MPVGVNVDVGIAETIRLFAERRAAATARRADGQKTVQDKAREQVALGRDAMKSIEGLAQALLSEYDRLKAVRNASEQEDLRQLNVETRKFLQSNSLVFELVEAAATLRTIGADPRVAPDLAAAITAVSRALDDYLRVVREIPSRVAAAQVPGVTSPYPFQDLIAWAEHAVAAADDAGRQAAARQLAESVARAQGVPYVVASAFGAAPVDVQQEVVKAVASVNAALATSGLDTLREPVDVLRLMTGTRG